MSVHCIQVYRAHMEEGDKYNSERGTLEQWPHECLEDGKLSLREVQTSIHFCPVQESGFIPVEVNSPALSASMPQPFRWLHSPAGRGEDEEVPYQNASNRRNIFLCFNSFR